MRTPGGWNREDVRGWAFVVLIMALFVFLGFVCK